MDTTPSQSWETIRQYQYVSPNSTTTQDPSNPPGNIDRYNGLTKLEWYFHNKVHDPALKLLSPVIKGLTRFRPSERMEAEEAIGLCNKLFWDCDYTGQSLLGNAIFSCKVYVLLKKPQYQNIKFQIFIDKIPSSLIFQSSLRLHPVNISRVHT